jgi:hypothetical protein
MRKLSLALSFLVLAPLLMLAGSHSGAVPQWTEYRVPDARFRVDMPGKPELTTVTIPELGSLKLTQAVLEAADGWFAASYVNVPPDQIKNMDADTVLDAARDTAIAWLTSRNDKSRLRADRHLVVSGYPARHVVAEVPILESTFLLVARFVFNGRQVIVITFTGPFGSETQPEVVRFFNSLSFQ